MLIDRGSYYEDTEAKFTPVYDKDGNYIGGYYCPYIPKLKKEAIKKILSDVSKIYEEK